MLARPRIATAVATSWAVLARHDAGSEYRADEVAGPEGSGLRC
jgi:hypothetical protein